MHLVLAIFIIGFLVLLPVFIFIHFTFFNEIYRQSTVPWASANNKPAVLTTIAQIVLGVWIALDKTMIYQGWMAFTILVLHLMQLGTCLSQQIYFSVLTSNYMFFLDFSRTMLLLLQAVSLAMGALPNLLSLLLTFLSIIGSTFCFAVFINKRGHMIKDPDVFLKNANSFEKYINNIEDLIEKNAKTSQAELIGFFISHCQRCTDAACHCKEMKKGNVQKIVAEEEKEPIIEVSICSEGLESYDRPEEEFKESSVMEVT